MQINVNTLLAGGALFISRILCVNCMSLHRSEVPKQESLSISSAVNVLAARNKYQFV